MKENFTVVDKNTGKTYWISRSIAVVTILVANDTGKILLQKRGPACPDEIGKWSLSCGYLNWDETTKDAAIRELYEETGIEVDYSNVDFWNLMDDPDSDPRQNIGFRFLATIEEEEPGDINTSERGGEKDEVTELRWFSPEEIIDTDESVFAFNHKDILMELFKEISEGGDDIEFEEE